MSLDFIVPEMDTNVYPTPVLVMSLTFGSLFAGIGGFDLGFERAGLVCKWQVEINEFCRKVLAKHWPDVRRHDDVKTFPPEGSDLDEYRVDVICGGFPCQDVSRAAAPHGRKGIDGDRSGLWSDFARIIRTIRPGYVVVENTTGLLDGGLDRVLGDMAEIGLDAVWGVLSSAAVGASDIRERLFVVAHADRKRLEGFNGKGLPTWDACRIPRHARREWWLNDLPRPRVLRSGHGVPNLVDRVKGLGNAVDPRSSEWIGRRLIEAA